LTPPVGSPFQGKENQKVMLRLESVSGSIGSESVQLEEKKGGEGKLRPTGAIAATPQKKEKRARGCAHRQPKTCRFT